MNQPTVLLCSRLANMPTPYVKSSTAFCGLCGSQVWVAQSSPPADQIWCRQCAAQELKEDAEFEPLTEDQVRDIDAYVKRGGA